MTLFFEEESTGVPQDDVTGMYTEISLYGIPPPSMYGGKNPETLPEKTVGICIEDPFETLRKLFLTHRVLSCNGYGVEIDHQIIGIRLSPFEPVFGITGRIQELLDSNKLDEARRTEIISPEYLQQIITRLETDDTNHLLDRNYRQKLFEKQQIADILKEIRS